MEPPTRQHLVTIQPARSPTLSSLLPRLARGLKRTSRCSSTMPILLSKPLQLTPYAGYKSGSSTLSSFHFTPYSNILGLSLGYINDVNRFPTALKACFRRLSKMQIQGARRFCDGVRLDCTWLRIPSRPLSIRTPLLDNGGAARSVPLSTMYSPQRVVCL